MRPPPTGRPVSTPAQRWTHLLMPLVTVALALSGGLALIQVSRTPLSPNASATTIPVAISPEPLTTASSTNAGTPPPQLLILITHTPIPTIPMPTRSPTPDVQYQMPFCGMGSRINEECLWPALTPTPDPGPPDCLTPAPKEVCRWRGERSRAAATPS